MTGSVSTRNIFVSGKRTSLKLEDEIWGAVDEICAIEDISIDDLLSELDAVGAELNRASRIRCFVVSYFRHAALSRSKIVINLNSMHPEKSETPTPIFRRALQFMGTGGYASL